MGWLDGKVALVIGGGSGIGRGVVEAFLREGASVGVLEINPQKVSKLEEHGTAVKAIQGDATMLKDNERAVRFTVETFGRLDILVSCVGVWDYFADLPNIPAEKISDAFDELFAVNVKSNLLSAKAALPELLKTEGNIVLTVSNSGFYPAGGGPLYVSSKFAVRGLIMELAYELAPKIRVNGVAPGGTITDLSGLKSLEQQNMSLSQIPNLPDIMRTTNPLQVLGTPEDHAWAYVYLASKERTRTVTGTIIHTDGGIGVRGIGKVAGLLPDEK
ncbi:biphenyl dihydrodiol dehydroganse (plasmid) [Geobacillus genomosp. 3]|uniref:Biphenyl dihydrodiol dehydroganse n=1 Tax=Geobacillus genomosp. 3 TaxID=1921421 RepID=S5Z4B2_GEOG3|nr:3-(cis-5,6-dihydroxycyclohexa-1,3-dien-1-yl)propanoate dehydrogenase [Geobacillus genomosp. 3]AGT33884.1 biphenyl dihydrodiol dehydroganse [Geobacillus genomosp. 3]